MSRDSKLSSGERFAGSASGTTAFRRTDLSTRQQCAVVAGVLLVAWGYGSQFLPELPENLNALLSALISLTLVAIVVWGMATLDVYGHWLLMVAGVILPFAMLMIAFDAIPFANVAKVLLAAVVGLWLAQGMAARSWIVMFVLASSLADIGSVIMGPTRMLLDHSPEVVGGFTVAIALFGHSLGDARAAIGVSDIVFFAMYLGAARRFALRESASVVVMVLSVALVFLAALSTGVLPVLPVLGLFFIAANLDHFVKDVSQASQEFPMGTRTARLAPVVAPRVAKERAGLEN
jgi:hypothetical protein